MVSWVTDYLTDRPQFVCFGTALFDVRVRYLEASQGNCPVSIPSLYTTDFQYKSESAHLQKFSDDCSGWVYNWWTGGGGQSTGE